MVFHNLMTMFLKDRERKYFQDRSHFLASVQLAARRSFNAEQASLRPKHVQFVEPAKLDVASAEDDWSGPFGLISNCEEACREYLADADNEVRQVFMLKCQGTLMNHKVPTGREIARQLGVRETDVSVWWGIAREFFRAKCGRPANADSERSK